MKVSICVPAYNEGKNITKILDALIAQKTKHITIHKIVVVSSGSTDETEEETLKYCKKHPQCHLIRQAERKGKAAAINAFLKTTDDEIVVIESADTIPEPDAIEKLCLPFIKDPKIGMTGGAPIPVNDRNTFLGYIIHTWWWFHRHIPRFGEIIAYRNILTDISPKTAVDEAYIQAKLIQLGYKIVHVDEAVVRNKGPETVADLIRQRRRIFNGHARLHDEENVKIDNMTKSSLALLLIHYKIKSVQEFIWFVGGVALEAYARILGMYDSRWKKINPYIWDTATTTKNLKHDLRKRVVFLNFAPIQFMGGAERWMHEVSSATGKIAKTALIDVHPKIANVYGRMVLGQEFNNRAKEELGGKDANHFSLTWTAFIPLSNAWRKCRSELLNANTIYIRYEVLEMLILLYFGGFSAFKKTVAGIHTPFIYQNPQRFLDHVHNFVYASRPSQFMLGAMQKVHVLNEKQKQLFTSKFSLKNVIYVPNYPLNSKSDTSLRNGVNKDALKVAFVGELNKRKGADVLIDTIKTGPKDVNYEIAGSGPLEEQIKEIAKLDNVKYHGYMNQEQLTELYSESDILFQPSRAESLSLVSLEAMSHGLPIVSSADTDIGLPSYVQEVNKDKTASGYHKIFNTTLKKKRNNELNDQKQKIQDYARKTFSKQSVLTKLINQVFEIKRV